MPTKRHATIQITVTKWGWRPWPLKRIGGWMVNAGVWLCGPTKYRLKYWAFDPAAVQPALMPALK